MKGKLMYSRHLDHSYRDAVVALKVLPTGHTLAVTELGVTRVVPPLHEFRVRLRAQETTKIWTHLKQSYALKSARLRSQAWVHCLALLSDKSAPLKRPGVERYDPSGK
jgi:hypothetical protein